jgi:hypothetical protein
VTGCIGGIYGIGGGAVLSPILIGSDRPAAMSGPNSVPASGYLIRRVLGILAIAIAVQCLRSGLG